MQNLLYDLKLFFEKLDKLRDKLLFVVIKPFWPRKILPNYLTILRLIIGISLFVLLFYFKNDEENVIISLFCIGILTDLFDGSVARAFHKETKVGAILDPIADRVLIIPIAVYSLFYSHKWLFLTIIVLEIISAILSIYSHGKNILFEADIFGKIKMVLQSIVFAAILIFWPAPPNLFFIYILWLSVDFLIISIIFKIIEVKKVKTNFYETK